jgi:hypothetical protein
MLGRNAAAVIAPDKGLLEGVVGFDGDGRNTSLIGIARAEGIVARRRQKRPGPQQREQEGDDATAEHALDEPGTRAKASHMDHPMRFPAANK